MRVRGTHQVDGGRRRGLVGWRRAVVMTVAAAVPLAASVAAAVPASAAGGYAVTDTITVGVVPRGVAVDPISHSVYVANFYDDTVSVIGHGRAPAITRTPAYTATIGKPMHLVITATGYPAPTVTESGALPCRLHFISTRNGHAAIVGTPGKGMAGRYPLTITATNQFGATSQTLVLRVRRP